MALSNCPNDFIHWYLEEIKSRIVAQSGIPTDRYHLGKIILQSLKDGPDFLVQIDGATGERESSGSVLARSVRCARALTRSGLRAGDVMALMAPNHIHLAIPFYAALYLGIIIAPIDRTSVKRELKESFGIIRPSIIFCQSENASEIRQALVEINLNCRIVTFDDDDQNNSFSDFLEEDLSFDVNEFRPTDINAEDAIGFLLSTSGTTGTPKAVAATYKSYSHLVPYLWKMHTEFPTPTRMMLIFSPLQWLTATTGFLVSPIMRFTRLQSSRHITKDHAYHLINTYKPTFTIMSPFLMQTLLLSEDIRERCDFSCFETISVGGSAVPSKIFIEAKKLLPKTLLIIAYASTEAGLVFDTSTPDTCGRPMGGLLVRLVNVDNQEEINECNVQGELWVKGPGVFKEYYNNPEETAKAFSKDRWFRTGDIFYRDEHWNFYFVDRIKMMLMYKGHQISPFEIETVVQQHPGVSEVAVTGISHPEFGDMAVACVVRKNETVSAEDIKNFVKGSLCDTKQLTGGIVFMDKLPVTVTMKIDRKKLKEMVLHMNKE